MQVFPMAHVAELGMDNKPFDVEGMAESILLPFLHS
jgi:hypothetical protein